MANSTKIQEIASRVKELREISDVSVEEMAEQLNMTVEKFLSYENAEVDFPVRVNFTS
jgi:transcriptional regulator with XRE-family HTH domain